MTNATKRNLSDKQRKRIERIIQTRRKLLMKRRADKARKIAEAAGKNMETSTHTSSTLNSVTLPLISPSSTSVSSTSASSTSVSSTSASSASSASSSASSTSSASSSASSASSTSASSTSASSTSVLRSSTVLSTSQVSTVKEIGKPTENSNKAKICLVTFDNLRKYAAIARAFVMTHSKVGIDKYLRWQQPTLEKTAFYKKNINLFTTHKKGFGGWIWKPYIIYDALKKTPDGDYIYYQDCYNDRRGFVYNVRPVIDFMEKNKIEILPGLMEPSDNKSFMKVDLLKHFDFDKLLSGDDKMISGKSKEAKFLSRKHICASPIFIKKSPETVAIIKEWLDVCQIPNLILPYPNPTNVQHNYDMSIWNCILEKYNIRPLNVHLSKTDTKSFNIFLKLFENRFLTLLQ